MPTPPGETRRLPGDSAKPRSRGRRACSWVGGDPPAAASRLLPRDGALPRPVAGSLSDVRCEPSRRRRGGDGTTNAPS